MFFLVTIYIITQNIYLLVIARIRLRIRGNLFVGTRHAELVSASPIVTCHSPEEIPKQVRDDVNRYD